jgi:hypothetical protein
MLVNLEHLKKWLLCPGSSLHINSFSVYSVQYDGSSQGGRNNIISYDNIAASPYKFISWFLG